MHLETDRLLIKPLTLENLDDYAAIVADPEVQFWLNQGIPRTRAYATEYLENLIKILKENGFSRYGVFDRKSRELLGHCGFKDIDGRTDIGWTYSQKSWGQGIGTEAAKAVIAYGFDEFEFGTISARAFSGNLGSIGIMRKVGMVKTLVIPFEDEDYPQYSGLEFHQYEITNSTFSNQ